MTHPLDDDILMVRSYTAGNLTHVEVTHVETGLAGDATDHSYLIARELAKDNLLARLEVLGGC